MTSPQTVSSIVLGAVPVPYAIAFHPKTHIYYELQKPVQEMDTADWIDFITGIITEKSQVCVLQSDSVWITNTDSV